MLSLISFCLGKPAKEEAAMRHLAAAPLAAFFLLCSALAQVGTQSTVSREIQGVVRVDNQPAPAGILVLLDNAPNRDGPPPAGTGQLGRTMTDSGGRFRIQWVQLAHSGSSGLYAVTAHASGYKDAIQVVDMTLVPRASATLELHRDTSQDQPTVPPGGPGAAIDARQPASPEAAQAVRKGQQLLLEKHDPKGCIESLKKAVKLDPQFGPAHLLMGAAYVQLRAWQDAQSAFEKAVKLLPANGQALLGLAVTLNAQQNFKEAEKVSEQSLQVDPKSAEAHYELGKSFWGMGKWQEAEPHAVQAIALNKDFPPAHVLMGNIYLRKRDAGSALKEFQEYLRLDPQGPFAQPTRDLVDRLQKAVGQR
jgi:Flp pilus assembly protein TadD